MEDKEIKLRCLDLATRDAGTVGFVPRSVVEKAKVFYNWVIEAPAEKPPEVKRSPGRPKGTHKKA